ncbi:MAG: PQQ-like beta-propeller repeat protein [Planctomycetota bacterium]|nr:PQQ-like beta-propeller repeat protein [Planctomycetota bacterium]
MSRLLPGFFAVLGVISLGAWLTAASPVTVARRVPDTSSGPAAGAPKAAPNLSGQLTTGPGKPAALPGDWSCFRGKAHDGIRGDGQRLARSWPAAGPPVLWSLELGEGYAGPAVWSGRIYLLDYDRDKQLDALRCLSLADGAEIWRYAYPLPVKRNHGMSRTVPAVTDKCVIAFGPKCHVTALDPVSGKLLWAKDLVQEFGSTVPPWYAGQCPLIEDGRLILATCGDDLMIALDCVTGQVVWRTSNPRGWKMTHSSVIPMTLQDKRMFVYCGSGGVAGVAADNGQLLWDTDTWKIQIATIPSPLPVGDDRMFLAGGYAAGCMMLRIKLDGEKFVPEPVFRLKDTDFGATQQTPILFEGNIYGVRPGGELACLDLDGQIRWTSGARRFGLGPFLIADGLLYAMDDNGKMTLAEASPSGFRPLAQAQLLQGHDAWGPMALVGGRLLARDFTRMVCLDVSETVK